MRKGEINSGEVPHSRALIAIFDVDFRQSPPTMSAPVCRTRPAECWHTEAHQRRRGGGDGDGVRGHGGQRRQLPASNGSTSTLSRRTSSRRLTTASPRWNRFRWRNGRPVPRRGGLRRPLLACGVVGADPRPASVAARCGTPTRANDSTTSPSARRREAAEPGGARELPGRQDRGRRAVKEKVENFGPPADLAGVPRK